MKPTTSTFMRLWPILVIILTGCSNVRPNFPSSIGDYNFTTISPGVGEPAAPFTSEPITNNNVNQLALVERWGKGIVHDMDIAPDGKTIAVSSSTGVYTYDIDTLEERIIRSYDLASGRAPSAIAFSPDGKNIALAQDQIVIWNLSNQQAEKRIKNVLSDFEIKNIEFSRDGKSLVIMGRGGNAPCDGSGGAFQIYDIEQGKLLYYRYFCPGSAIFYFRTSTDGTVLFTGVSPDPWLYYESTIVDASTGSINRSIQYESARIVDFSPDGTLMAIQNNWDNKATTELVDVKTNKVVTKVEGDVIFLPQPNKLLATLDSNDWRLQDLDGNVTCKFFNEEHKLNLSVQPYQTKFQVRGPYLATWSSWSQEIQIWNTTNCHFETSIPFWFADESPEFSPDGKTLATGSSFYLHLWDTYSGTVRHSIPGSERGGPVRAYAFHPSSAQIVVGSSDYPYTLRFVDVQSGEILRTLPGYDHFIDRISISPDGNTIATLDGHRLHLWDINNGVPYFQSEIFEYSPLAQLFYSPDSSTIALIKNWRPSYELVIYEEKTGQILENFELLSYQKAAMSSDWSFLAIAGGGGTISIWDQKEKAITQRLLGHGRITDQYSYTYDIAITPDGNLIASTEGNRVRFWDPLTGQLVGEIAPEFVVREIKFSPDGRRMATAGDDGTIRIWEIRAEN